MALSNWCLEKQTSALLKISRERGIHDCCADVLQMRLGHTIIHSITQHSRGRTDGRPGKERALFEIGLLNYEFTEIQNLIIFQDLEIE
jgi:hypothetical protein